jgi:thiol-disulfide isomerase/thioredoxin
MKILKAAMVLALLNIALFAKTEFVLTDIHGKKYHVSEKPTGLEIKELKDKVIFLSFFGFRCPPCMMEIPEFISFTNDKKFTKKAAIVAVEVQGLRKDELKDFAKRKGISYITISGNDYYDFIEFISSRTSWKTKWRSSIPFMVLFDKKGDYVAAHVGMVSKDILADLTDKLSKEK